MHSDDFNHEVLDAILNSSNDDELRVVAEQIVRDVKSGSSLEKSLTEAQYVLGLDVSEVRKVEAFILEAGGMCIKCHKPLPATQTGGMCNGCYATDKGVQGQLVEAGLKTTLRQLRRQLNQADHEDLDGLNKLLSAIQGLEKQLEQKDKARDERRKKKESEPKTDEPKDATADAEGLKPDLKQDIKPKSKIPDGLKADSPMNEDPTASLPERQEQHIQLTREIASLKKGIAPALMRIKELSQKSDDPLLKDLLAQIEDKVSLMEYKGEKWQTRLIETESQTNEKAVWEAFEPRLMSELKGQEELVQRLNNILSGMRNSPAYKSETKPYLKSTPTSKPLQTSPHTLAPSEQDKKSFYVAAEDFGSTGDQLGAIQGELSSLLDALSESMQTFLDLFEIAESKTQTA